MGDIIAFLTRIFTEAPYIWLSWPAVAMLAGTLLAVISQGSAAKLAIVPRTTGGLIGIFTAPFIHANFAHLAANLPPFLVLGGLALRRNESQFLETILLIAVVQGLLLWLLGRKASHVGMSGVIFGFLGWLLAAAWFTQATSDLLIAGGVILVYGGMLAGIAPARDGTSWEGHLFGLIAGVGVIWLTHGM
jgi:membrane associated rhomboid family serine protease